MQQPQPAPQGVASFQAPFQQPQPYFAPVVPQQPVDPRRPIAPAGVVNSPQPQQPHLDADACAKIEAIRAAIAAQTNAPEAAASLAPGPVAAPLQYSAPQQALPSQGIPAINPIMSMPQPICSHQMSQPIMNSASASPAAAARPPLNMGTVDLFSILKNAGIQPAVNNEQASVAVESVTPLPGGNIGSGGPQSAAGNAMQGAVDGPDGLPQPGSAGQPQTGDMSAEETAALHEDCAAMADGVSASSAASETGGSNAGKATDDTTVKVGGMVAASSAGKAEPAPNEAKQGAEHMEGVPAVNGPNITPQIMDLLTKLAAGSAAQG